MTRQWDSQFLLHLNRADHEKLREIAERNGLSMSAFLRRELARVIEREEKKAA